MTWMLWIAIGYVAFSVAVTPLSVGKQRKPTTPGVAAAAIASGLILIALIFFGGVAS